MKYLNIYQKKIKSDDIKSIYCSHDELDSYISAVANTFFCDQILYGKKILIKPNFVRDFRNTDDSVCLTTNFNLIYIILKKILKKRPASIIVGDAPIQGADWEKMVSPYFLNEIDRLSLEFNIPISVLDFRRTILNKNKNFVTKEKKPLNDYVIFDLGKKSFLEPISNAQGRFRVTDYDPDRLCESHGLGYHKYCITKELFDADVVLSLPKLKTHQKTGLTCALKNLVGLIGDKDYLPHHRIGGTGFGGDCYPGKNYLRRFSEFFLDKANKNIGKKKYSRWKFFSKVFWKISLPTSKHQLAAGWHGNDTTWRMVLDLNLIAMYGQKDGTISDIKQRDVYSLCDGVVAGHGDGPLNPKPFPLGVVAFSNDSAVMDAAMATLMGFDVQKIPLIKESLTCLSNCSETRIKYNGVSVDLNILRNYSAKAQPAPGWVGEIEYEN